MVLLSLFLFSDRNHGIKVYELRIGKLENHIQNGCVKIKARVENLVILSSYMCICLSLKVCIDI
jgi:hypothetical protein